MNASLILLVYLFVLCCFTFSYGYYNDYIDDYSASDYLSIENAHTIQNPLLHSIHSQRNLIYASYIPNKSHASNSHILQATSNTELIPYQNLQSKINNKIYKVNHVNNHIKTVNNHTKGSIIQVNNIIAGFDKCKSYICLLTGYNDNGFFSFSTKARSITFNAGIVGNSGATTPFMRLGYLYAVNAPNWNIELHKYTAAGIQIQHKTKKSIGAGLMAEFNYYIKATAITGSNNFYISTPFNRNILQYNSNRKKRAVSIIFNNLTKVGVNYKNKFINLISDLFYAGKVNLKIGLSAGIQDRMIKIESTFFIDPVSYAKSFGISCKVEL